MGGFGATGGTVSFVLGEMPLDTMGGGGWRGQSSATETGWRGDPRLESRARESGMWCAGKPLTTGPLVGKALICSLG